MKRRLSMWALAGVAIACCWAAIGLFAGPAYNLGRSTVAAVTAPAAIFGRRAPLSVASFILLNGMIYVTVGLAAELARRLHSSR